MTTLSAEPRCAIPSPAARAGSRGNQPFARVAGRTGIPSTFWFGFWLAIVCIATKWIGWRSIERMRGWPTPHPFRTLCIATNADLLFVLAASIAFQIGLSLAAKHRRFAKAIWGSWIAFCVVAVFYAIASVPVFHEFHAPLTYPLIALASDVRGMRSSIAASLSVSFFFSLALIPPAYLFLAIFTHRRFQPRRTAWVRVARAALLLMFLARYAIIQRTYLPEWKWEGHRRLAESPHWALLTSCVTEMTGRGAPRLSGDFPVNFTSEFQPTRAPASGFSPPGTRPHNVILLVLESVGVQYLSPYGSHLDTMPRLQRELNHALVFDNFYSHDGMTSASLLAITNSTYPQTSWMPDTERTPDIAGTALPQVLKPLGYRSAFITSADISWAGQNRFLAHRGFDRMIHAADLRDAKLHPSSWGVEDRYLIDGMLAWIDQERGKPFFLVGWTTQTHHPYLMDADAPEENFMRGESSPAHPLLNRYLNVLRATDQKIAALLDALRQRGLADDTLVVITGDHGECFGSPHATLAHGWHVYEENDHVPCIFWNPRLFPEARRSPVVGGHIDLNPTILDLLGLPAPKNVWQGRSLFDASRPPRAYSFAALGDYQLAVRDDHWKLIYNATLGEHQLFDLASDPTEQHDIASADPDRCRELRAHLLAWLNFQNEYMESLRREGTRK